MKFVEVRNVTRDRIVIPAVRGLAFEPGEVKKVSPATVKHPAVSSRIGRGLTLVTSSQGEEPKAPIPTVTEPPKVVVVPEPPKVVVEVAPEPPPPPPPVEVIPEPAPVVAVPEPPQAVAVETESPKPVEPEAEPMPVPEPPVMETPMETAGNLQEAYLAAPGISEENVEAILTAFPTFAALSSATLSSIQEASGLSKTASRKLRDWASSQS